MHPIFSREAFDLIILVLPDTGWKIGRNAYVESSSCTAGEDVQAGIRSRVLAVPFSLALLVPLLVIPAKAGINSALAFALNTIQSEVR
jgi:hypothetical protein